MININISHKDKSMILLIMVALIILWFVVSGFSAIYNTISFKSSEINKINSVNKKDWFNVAESISSKDLSGKIIVLHFWSYSCTSCIESIKKMKLIESLYPNSVAVIGVHSPIFEHEKQYSAVKKSIIRYKIDYPVINDANLEIKSKFKIKQIPSFLVFNINGKIAEMAEGANSVDKVVKIVKKLVKKNKYSLNRDRLPTVLESSNVFNILDAPSKMVFVNKFSYKNRQFPALIIANSGGNSIIVAQISGEMVLEIGGKTNGFVDGKFSNARFSYPQSVLYDGSNIYVADTGNNAIRIIDIKDGKVETVIGGSGNRGDIISSKNSNYKDINLSAPTDIEFYPNNSTIVISNSGTNQILAYDIKSKNVSIFAGNGDSGQIDGAYPDNSLAQTADMAVYGGKLYLLDAKTSALRVLNKDGLLKTIYSSIDEKTESKKLQNPRALLVDDTGAYIADSFNHAIRKFDFNNNQISNLVGGNIGDDLGQKTRFDEPSGIVSIIDKMYVADSNNNRIVAVNRANGNSVLLDIMPAQRLIKETFVEYLPNLEDAPDVFLKALTNIDLNIELGKGWKINPIGPSFVNLLEFQDDNNANLIETFDWNKIKDLKIKLPKLEDGRKYLLQGKIYFCQNSANSLCYIKSYEQIINAKSDTQDAELKIKIER